MANYELFKSIIVLLFNCGNSYATVVKGETADDQSWIDASWHLRHLSLAEGYGTRKCT
jgi:hypothetical protein